jgi:transposase
MPTGRPTALTPEVQRRVCEAIAAGNTRHDAAEYAGVGASTVRAWLAKGQRQSRGRFRAFLAAIKKAEADAVVRNVAIIHKAATKSWQAAAWWLERKRGEDWSQNKDVIHQLVKEVQELKKLVGNRRTSCS